MLYHSDLYRRGTKLVCKPKMKYNDTYLESYNANIAIITKLRLNWDSTEKYKENFDVSSEGPLSGS
jgi:hypothetical protein